jgi:hypothetical protein
MGKLELKIWDCKGCQKRDPTQRVLKVFNTFGIDGVSRLFTRIPSSQQISPQDAHAFYASFATELRVI